MRYEYTIEKNGDEKFFKSELYRIVSKHADIVAPGLRVKAMEVNGVELDMSFNPLNNNFKLLAYNNLSNKHSEVLLYSIDDLESGDWIDKYKEAFSNGGSAKIMIEKIRTK